MGDGKPPVLLRSDNQCSCFASCKRTISLLVPITPMSWPIPQRWQNITPLDQPTALDLKSGVARTVVVQHAALLPITGSIARTRYRYCFRWVMTVPGHHTTSTPLEDEVFQPPRRADLTIDRKWHITIAELRTVYSCVNISRSVILSLKKAHRRKNNNPTKKKRRPRLQQRATIPCKHCARELKKQNHGNP